MTILFRPQGAFGWFSYTTSRDTILPWIRAITLLALGFETPALLQAIREQ
ncbi:hypothetical protein [Pseudomonas hunanensis]